ncbi:hypothetical protein ACYPKM_04290 [Pseudomonas aeruginosa]
MIFNWFKKMKGKQKPAQKIAIFTAATDPLSLTEANPEVVRGIIASTNVKVFMKLDDPIPLLEGK